MAVSELNAKKNLRDRIWAVLESYTDPAPTKLDHTASDAEPIKANNWWTGTPANVVALKVPNFHRLRLSQISAISEKSAKVSSSGSRLSSSHILGKCLRKRR